MKDPAVLFYTKDFLTGTAFFSDAERGQYIRLLCEQHQNGHIPENHMVSVCFSLGSPVAKKFIIDSDGNYFNERMEEEIKKREKFIQSRTDNGSKGGRPKEIKKPNDKPLGLPTENLIANANGNVIVNVIEYLNIKTNKNFKSNSKTTIKHINARITEGFTLDQFKKVIDIKVSKWLNDPKMVDYLRPETLFGTKFESYLNENGTYKQNNEQKLTGKWTTLAEAMEKKAV
jgi:uncharacterized phage protein (TIGR02220 family)